MASADSFDGFDIASRSTTSSTSNTNIPSISDINSITPGTIFNDDLPPSFLDATDTDYSSSPSSSPPPSTQSTTNKSGGGHIGQIEVNSTIQTILVILGIAVGALFLLGVVAMYYITHKNRRAEEKKKLRDEEAVAKAAVSKSVRNSVSSHTHPTLTGGNGIGGGGGSGANANNPHRIIITRSMTATTAHTRIGTSSGPGSDEKNGGGAGAGGRRCSSGGISPIGDGKSDMVTIYIDDTPEDDILARKHHHCDNDDGNESGMDVRMNEKQELDEGVEADGSQQEREEQGKEAPSQEHSRNLTHPYPAPHKNI